MMTFELLTEIIKENNIPSNVELLSDSGWECCATDMDGVYYNKLENTVVFTHMMNLVKERRELNDIFEVKKIIKEYYNEASYGLFFNRNNVGDKMINIYNKNGIQIDICYDYGYFEIFGLDSLQKTELTKFYENLKNNIRK